MVKMKVINILSHCPAYELCHSESRPKINWNTPNGSWVGIWGDDWPDLIGGEVLKLTKEFEYEVWQPDVRADKIYSHVFENGLVHKLFPAKIKKSLVGFKLKKKIQSNILIDNIALNSRDSILHLNAIYRAIDQEIINKFPYMPKLIEFHGKSSTPYYEAIRPRKNLLTNISYYILHKNLLKNRHIFFVYKNLEETNTLSKYKSLGYEKIYMGCDFNFWRPGNKDLAKKRLEINPSTKVFTMASRFVKLKQIDKVIEVFNDIDTHYNFDFKLIIAGHGDKKYENYLKKNSNNLIKKKKLIFTGYLKGVEMLTLYQASDLYISASLSEGGQVSVIKAIACNTPIMCTNVGGVDIVLKENNAGILVDSRDYKSWKFNILKVLRGEKTIKTLERVKAEKLFHWPNIAKKFVYIYQKLKGTM